MLRSLIAFTTAMLIDAVAFGASYRVVPTFVGGPRLGERSLLEFQLFRGRSDVPLTSADLQLEHEKRIHLFTLDSGFQEYRHEHPEEVRAGVWQVPFTVSIAGAYRFWIQILPVGETSTKTLKFDQDILHFPGEVVPDEPVSSAVALTWTDGSYEVTLSFPAGEPVQHTMAPLRFVVKKDGVEVPQSELDPYLGAKMHIVAVSATRDDFVHIHPHAEGDVMAHFMEAGFYGLFMQFSHEGVLHTTHFGAKVNPHNG